MAEKRDSGGTGSLEQRILDQLRSQGIDLAQLACGDQAATPVRVVCVAANVGHTLDQMGQSTRDQVVTVRVDADAAAKLDAWVETGAVKSRSEAAALFIREGLQVRAKELSELRAAIDDVEKARERLKDRVRDVLGLDE